MINKRNHLKIVGLTIVFLFIYLSVGCSAKNDTPIDNIAMVVSVSSDGNYAVTSNLNKQFVLWDIKNKTSKIIDINTNIYSAYFIKNTHDFMWQDLKDIVHIQNINGKELLSFHGFPSYGEVMTSDLKYYIASDKDWNLYVKNRNKLKLIKPAFQGVGFFGEGKLLNLTLSNNNKYLLTSGSGGDSDKLPISAGASANQAKAKGYQASIRNFSLFEGIVTWDISTGQPLMKFPGTVFKAFATLSPDGKYIVSGDENDNGFVWYTRIGKLKFDLDSMKFGHPVDPKKPMGKWDKKGLIPVPKDFHDQMNMYLERVLAMKFIDNTHYLRFTTGIPYVIVYSVDSSRPLKYIKIAGPIKTADLTKERYPAVAEYVRDQAIDTAPKAHILVMGQQKGNGIIVFKYDPKTMTLKKIWVGNFCGPRSGNPKCW